MHFEFNLIERPDLAVYVLIGALQVHYSYVLKYGARDVKSLIRCEARACGRFKVGFVHQGNGHFSLPFNKTSAAREGID